MTATAVAIEDLPAAGWRRAVTLAVLTTITMLYAMTVTIANVALPQMQGSLSATQDEIALVVTFNIVATAVATPTSGWLARRFSRRAIMIWCVFFFTLASLLCGMAVSLEMLVFFRIAQGAFGAPLVPLAQAMALEMYPRERQGQVQALFGMGVIMGPIIAPTIGGYLSELYGWRWVFFMIVPIGLMVLVGVMVFVRDRRRTRRAYLDWTGFLALSIGIASFQYLLDRGHRLDWFDSWTIILCACVAGLAIYVFVVHSATARQPFINPELFQDRNFTIGLLLTFIFGMLNFTPITLLPTMLQNLRGFPDSEIGLVLAARGSGTLAGFIIMFWASRFDPRYTASFGFLLQAVSGWYMAGFSINVSYYDIIWTSMLQGLGVGFLWVPLTLITFNTLDRRHLNEGTAIFHLVRNFGSSIFISFSIAIVLRSTQVNYAELSENISPLNPIFSFPNIAGPWGALGDPTAIATLSAELARQAHMIGYINAFYAFAITATLALPLIFMVRIGK